MISQTCIFLVTMRIIINIFTFNSLMATQESWGKLWSIGTRNWKIVSTLKLQSSTSQTSIKYLCVVMSRHIISMPNITKLSRSQKPEDTPTNGRWGASCRSGWRSSWTHPSTSATGKTMNRSSSSCRHHRLEQFKQYKNISRITKDSQDFSFSVLW